MKCKHRDSWLITAGRVEWCWRCGAFRTLEPVPGGEPACNPPLAPTSAWSVPVGHCPLEPNPFDAWTARTATWIIRMRTRKLNALRKRARGV